MPKESKTTQKSLIEEFFKNNPNRDIKHPEAVDWLVAEYKKRTGQTFRDPDRGIRKLYQTGFLLKVSKGIYRYDPDKIGDNRLQPFSAITKKLAFERDGYKCVVCGEGREHGHDLHIDHIVPQDKGGTNDLNNAQTLCSRHNFMKKNLNQTETGKKMFVRLLEKAREEGNEEIAEFCEDILKTFDSHNINGHIEWE